MKLADWLKQADEKDVEFARRIQVSRQALARYKKGARIPRRDILGRIQRETNDAVRPADFFEGAA